MAKSKSFFGLRRGSTKSLTFSVYEGQQVTKDRVTEVKNPRTPSQMIQRMVMATCLNLYSAGKEIFDHSFQGVTYGAKSMNKFLSDNAKLARASFEADDNAFHFAGYGNRAPQGCQCKISEGTLAPIANQFIKGGTASGTLAIMAGESVTVAQLRAALGLSVGDYVTYVGIAHASGTYDVGEAKQPNNGELVFARLYMPAGDDTVLSADNINNLLTPELKGIASVSLTSVQVGGTAYVALQFKLNASFNEGLSAWGAIKSAKLNGVWARSTQYFYNRPSTIEYLEAEAALSTYPVGPAYVLNGGDQ